MKKRQKILEKRLVSLTKPNKHQLTLKTDPKVNCLLKCEWITIWETIKCYLIFLRRHSIWVKAKSKSKGWKHETYILSPSLYTTCPWQLIQQRNKCSFWTENISKNKSLGERATKHQTHHFKPLQGAVDYE